MSENVKPSSNLFDRITKITIGFAVLTVVAVLIASNVPVNFAGIKIEKQKDIQQFKNELIPAQSTTALPLNYEIKKGDTLWSIAQNHYSSGFEWTKIAKANPQLNPRSLEVGQKITIPDLQVVQTPPELITTAQTQMKITSDSYQVVRGDTLWSISLRAFGDAYRWTEIAKANNLSNPSVIHQGNILKIPRN